MINTCDHGDNVVVYESRCCDLCEAFARINELEKEIKQLKEEQSDN